MKDEATFSALLRSMELLLPAERMGERRELLCSFDTAARALDSHPPFATHDAYREQAYTVLKGSVSEANNLAATMSDRVKAMSAKYHAWAKRVNVEPWPVNPPKKK